MATINAIKKEAKRLMEINPRYTLEEAMELAKYDLECTSSDAASRTYLEEETRDCDISLEEAETMFAKKAKKTKQPVLTKKQQAFNAKAMENIKERRVEYLVSEIEKRADLFGDVEYDVNSIKGIAPESGLPYTIKIAKHKTQKVFDKVTLRKKNASDITMAEQRAMALGFILAIAPKDLFEATTYSNSAFGFVNRDAKFPYGSIKLTQHKK